MKIFKRIVLVLITWFMIHVIYISLDGFVDLGKNADAAVILGSKVNINGTLSQRLTKRMECGLEMYNKGRVKKLIVSGGLGVEGHYEGNKMKEYLIQKGVPNNIIFVDNYGNNTEATVINTLKMRDSIKYNSLVVVSQYFHVTRTKMLYRKHGFKALSSVCPNYFEIRDPYSILREFVGFYTQW
jgi:vancomycin permeability regulator SanA